MCLCLEAEVIHEGLDFTNPLIYRKGGAYLKDLGHSLGRGLKNSKWIHLVTNLSQSPCPHTLIPGDEQLGSAMCSFPQCSILPQATSNRAKWPQTETSRTVNQNKTFSFNCSPHVFFPSNRKQIGTDSRQHRHLGTLQRAFWSKYLEAFPRETAGDVPGEVGGPLWLRTGFCWVLYRMSVHSHCPQQNPPSSQAPPSLWLSWTLPSTITLFAFNWKSMAQA